MGIFMLASITDKILTNDQIPEIVELNSKTIE